MAIVYCMPVYEQAMSGTTSQGTQASLNSKLAQAEKFFVQARVTQVSGTSPTLTVTLEHSNDDVNFTTKATLINASALNANSQNNVFGQDLGTSQVGGCSMRLVVTLGGTNPGAYVQLWLTGRTND